MGRLGEQLHRVPKPRELLAVAVAHSPAGVAAEHPFEDACQLPVPERHVEVDCGGVPAGQFRVAGKQFGFGGESGRSGSGGHRERSRLAGVGPVDQEQAEVGEWVAERAQFPVENRHHLPAVAQHAVVEPVIAVHDGGGALDRDEVAKLGVHLFHDRQVTGARRLELPVPALQLTFDVAVVSGEVTEANRGGIDGVDASEHLDEGFTGAGTLGRGEQVGVGGVTDNDAVDEVHDVERCTVHCVVAAQAHDRSDRHVGRGESGKDAMFTAHVVGGGEDLPKWWPAEHPALAVGVGHAVRQIRVAAGDQLEPQRWRQSGDAIGKPGGDLRCIDSGGRSARICGKVVARWHADTLPAGRSVGATSAPYRCPMVIDVTDATFEAEVLDRSAVTPVVVDLWATWCGPCRTLGPILEKVIGESEGRVVLAKVDTDANPQTAAAFSVQSIPAVYAVVDRKVVNGFIGARGEREVREFVDSLAPSPEQQEVASLLASGDEESLRRALEIVPGDEAVVVALATLLADGGAFDEALGLLERVPVTAATRQVAARARLARAGGLPDGDDAIVSRLGELLEVVKDDTAARTEFLDLLEVIGPDDPRSAEWRRRLTTRLY